MSVARTREGKTNKIVKLYGSSRKKKSVERRKFKLTFALE